MARILVIDDEAAVRATIQIVLSKAGHDVSLAPDGTAGVAAFEEGQFDLVMVDLFMPGMDGIEIMRLLHGKAPEIPIVAMSGIMRRDMQHVPPDYLHMATKLGAASALSKPFKANDLIAAVDGGLAARRNEFTCRPDRANPAAS